MALINRTSFIDLLFPAKELEELGNKWPEPEFKRRKLEAPIPVRPWAQRVAVSRNQARSQQQRQQHQQHRLSNASLQESRVVNPALLEKRPASESQQPPKRPASNTSHIPSFIDANLMRNFLQNMHPKDRSRYESLVNAESASKRSPVEVPELLNSSPGSVTTDDATIYGPTTPTSSEVGIYESLHQGPYAPLLGGMRLTIHERTTLEDLLNPQPEINPKPETKPAAELIEDDNREESQDQLGENCATPRAPSPSPYKGFAVGSGYLFGDGDDSEDEDN